MINFSKPDGVRWGGVRGVTLLELILVLVMIATLGALGYPRLTQALENREARQALETMRAISQAMRLYELNRGSLPKNLADLEQEGYVKPTEYVPNFTYRINTTAKPPLVIADHVRPGRRIFLFHHPTVKGADGRIVDNKNFLTRDIA